MLLINLSPVIFKYFYIMRDREIAGLNLSPEILEEYTLATIRDHHNMYTDHHGNYFALKCFQAYISGSQINFQQIIYDITGINIIITKP